MTTVSHLQLRPAENRRDQDPDSADPGGGAASTTRSRSTLDLGNGSQVVYVARFLGYEESWNYFEYLNKHIPWTRPTIRVFGRSSVQPRDVCYVADKGLPHLVYSGYQPRAYSWDEFPPLKDMQSRKLFLAAVSTVYYLIGIKVGETMLVGMLMMKKFMDQLQKLLRFPSDANVSSC